MDKSSSKTTSTRLPFEKATTAATMHNLKEADSFEDFLANNKDNMLTQTLSEYLNTLLEQNNLKRANVVQNSDLDKAYVYQIFSGERKPSRDKLIAIAFGMHLNEEETQRILKLAGHSELYPRRGRDAMILFAIQHSMNIWETDEALDKNGFHTILSAE